MEVRKTENEKFRKITAEEMEQLAGGESKYKFALTCEICYTHYDVKPDKCPKCGCTDFFTAIIFS